MEQHYSNRPTQAHQQHVYSSSPYSVYVNQPAYFTSPYNPNAQHQQQVAYSHGATQYSRTPTTARAQSSSMQQRRGGGNSGAGGGGGGSGAAGGGGMSRSTGMHAGGSAAALCHGQQLTGAGAGDGVHIAQPAGTPMHSLAYAHHHRTMPSQDMPLRMVVDAKYVGAIIGQGGANIREITKDSKARCVVDVQRAVRDLAGNAEKVISILGQQENCTRACVRILEVVRKEMEKDASISQHPQIELKIRAHNQLVGRLIGKGGANIKKIMEDTGAVVYVSNEPAMSHEMMGMLPPYGGAPTPFYASDLTMNVERTITIRGPTMSAVTAAEQKISQKLRQSYEADLSSRMLYPQSTGALPLMAHIGSGGETAAAAAYLSAAGSPSSHYSRGGTAVGGGEPSMNAACGGGTGTGGAAGGGMSGASHQQSRVVKMWVPNNMVGALIGPKGVHIRSVMRMTGAHVRIEGGGGAMNKERKEKADTKEVKESSPEETTTVTTTKAKADEAAPEEEQPTENGGEGAAKKGGEKAPAEIPKKDDTTDKPASSSKPMEEKERDLHADERLVTITGNEPQQYKAQFWIYQRVAEQSYHYLDEVRLCTEIAVPSKLVGRIIGKGGQNVRELQRVTGAQVKIPDDAGEDSAQETTLVRVLGNFQSSQAVQTRLSQLIRDFAHKMTLYAANGQPGVGTASMQGASPSGH